MATELFGDWGKIPAFVNGLKQRWEKSVNQALLKEGHLLRKGMITGITSGAPAGQAFLPLSPLTLAIRKARGFGGNKPLIYTGTLRGSIVVHRAASGDVFIGLLRQAKAKNGQSLANLGEIHEFGRTWTQKRTRKQLRFLFAMMKKAGIAKPIGPKMPGGGFMSKNPDGTVTVSIPARPFVRPVLDKERPHIAQRFWQNVAKGMGGDLAPQ